MNKNSKIKSLFIFFCFNFGFTAYVFYRVATQEDAENKRNENQNKIDENLNKVDSIHNQIFLKILKNTQK